ncbi:MAG: PQQ-binding-like beta-propeller repeat protein [Planctomycetota bacterium]
MNHILLFVRGFAVGSLLLFSVSLRADEPRPLSMIVMDPLAAPLSCPCVEGYAQRQYGELAKHLQGHLNRRVEVTFADSLELAMQRSGGRADLIIGKHSVVESDASSARIRLVPLLQLTDKEGSTTQHGLVVVNNEDPARSAKDLVGYNIIFGPAEADEKHAAALGLLASAGVTPPKQLMIGEACSEGACQVIELGPDSMTAAVISSYAQPLLEGCGTIKKGELRVVGRTASVPFITAFASKRLAAKDRTGLRKALEAASEEPEVLEALESLFGFLPMAKVQRTVSRSSQTANAAANAAAASTWPGWRGPNRDGRVPHLPATLATEPELLWQVPLARAGLGGIAATDEVVIFGDRDLDDFHDVYRCLDAETGRERWRVERLAIGALDYGNSPRATPLIADNRVYCLGAHGTLLCISLAHGDVIWELSLQEVFGSPGELPWGWCGSPLLFGDRLIVNPGATHASVVALDADTGAVAWKCPGDRPSYGSFCLIRVKGKPQIVGYDQTSLGAWDPTSGRRLWRLQPRLPGDFQVPTPILHDSQLLVATENNGTRKYAFQSDGRLDLEPVATNRQLRPDMSTGVVVNDRLYCVNGFLFCLDLSHDLRELWRLRDAALTDYGSIFASPDRVLVISKGTLLLLNADGTDRIIARQRIFPDDQTVYSHPALVGDRLYIRGQSKLVSVRL